MRSHRKMVGWPGLLLGLLLAGPGLATAQQPGSPFVPPGTPQPSHPSAKPGLNSALPLEQLPPPVQGRARALLEHPTLRIQGPVEVFNCQPDQYYWLLDNPHLCVRLWRSLGAKVTDIQSLGGGRFAWSDKEGSQIHWHTVLRTSEHRVWLAEGHVKPGMLLPTVHVRALMAIHHSEGTDGENRPAIRHHVELVLQTDNAAVALAARLLGASAPHLAQQYVSQIEMFYGAMAWYLERYPRHAAQMLAELPRNPTDTQAESAGPLRRTGH